MVTWLEWYDMVMGMASLDQAITNIQQRRQTYHETSHAIKLLDKKKTSPKNQEM